MTTNEPKWIWNGDDPDDQNVWGWARYRFDLMHSQPVDLEISADLRYMVWVNGQRIGFGPPKFHAPTPTVDYYDITDVIQARDNVIAVLVYSLGDYAISSVMPKRGALWVRMKSGPTEIVSDRRWKMRRDVGYLKKTASRGCSQPPCEIYDARLALGEPEVPQYDDSEWPYAIELEAPKDTQLENRDIPFMSAEAFAPDRPIEWGISTYPEPYACIDFNHLASAITRADTSPDRTERICFSGRAAAGTRLNATGLDPEEVLYVLFDMGRLWTGYPILKIWGTPGTIVDLIYSEDLSMHRPRPNKNVTLLYFDRVILSGSELSHRITWPKCARFIQLNVHGGVVTLNGLALERSTYPVQWKGFFSSDRPCINQAWEISAHTVQLNMEDSYMDTPWRERGSWLGDDLIKCSAAHAVFGDHALARRFLLQISRGQRADGTLASKYPANITSHITTWSLCFPLSVFEYCRSSGDWDFGSKMLPAVHGVIRWLDSRLTADGIYEAPPAHLTAKTGSYNFIDWAPVDMRGANTAWNAFAYQSLRCASALAQAAGAIEHAEQTAAKAFALRGAFQRLFWDQGRGIYVNGLFESKQLNRWGCQENLLALMFGLATVEQTASIRRRLDAENLDQVFIVDENEYDIILPECGKLSTVALALSCYRWPKDKMVPIGTPYFAGYLLRILIESGRAADAQDFIEKRWGEFSKQGATSVWEVWTMEQSLSHGWSCAPVLLAAHYFLGVHQAPFPEEVFRILPVAGRLNAARGRVMMRFGSVQVEWQKSPTWSLKVDLPVNGVFQVGLPVRDGLSLEVDGQLAQGIEVSHCCEFYQVISLSGGCHHLRHIAIPK